MDLSQSRGLVESLGGHFEWLTEVGSTNTALLNRSDLPHFSVIATDNQVAGRGRAGRIWQAPAGACLAISILVKPKASANANQFGWLPLLTGLAMARAVNQFIPQVAEVKWPNDVLVQERKISGVLSELLPDLSGVVIGAGLNLTLTEAELPVPTATSLLIEGATGFTTDEVLHSYLQNFSELYSNFAAHNFDANQSGLRQEVIESCSTLTREVRALLPGEREEQGKAVTIDDTGRLVIQLADDVLAVAAGDIVHMRHN